MKLIHIAVLVLLSSACLAQEKVPAAFAERLNAEVDSLNRVLASRDYLSDFEKKMTMQAIVDTFKIERTLTYRIGEDYSTMGMVTAIGDAEEAYDALLNKYYLIVMRRLSADDREVLKQSQRAWIAFRDADRNLNIVATKDEYSGGGSIQRLIAADRYLLITKQRVLDLFGYMLRMDAQN